MLLLLYCLFVLKWLVCRIVACVWLIGVFEVSGFDDFVCLSLLFCLLYMFGRFLVDWLLVVSVIWFCWMVVCGFRGVLSSLRLIVSGGYLCLELAVYLIVFGIDLLWLLVFFWCCFLCGFTFGLHDCWLAG